MLTGEKRSETVYAIRDSEVVRLSQAALDSLAQAHPPVALRLNRILARRLRLHLSGGRRQPNSLATFALLPAGRTPMPSDFGRRLVEALNAYGEALYLDSAAVDAQLGAGAARTAASGPESSRVAAWLNEMETQHRFVVYDAGTDNGAWAERCIRQSDRVLLVADADADPALSPAEDVVARLAATGRSELVLLHAPDTARPSGTCRWLDIRKVSGFYHLRVDDHADLRYLARRLTGHALGLVLGGGAARGWAHIGALRALREAGLEIDLIGGTSMGAVIGAMYAMGMDEHEIMQIARRFAAPLYWLDLTLPVVSLLKSDKATDVIREVSGDILIEDLWRPYFCVASNLTRATQVVFAEGELWQAVRASTAIPGILAPVSYQGDVLVDGAVLNNLPIDVMQGLGGGGPVVAVNVMPDVDLEGNYDFGSSVSGWSTLINRLNPFSDGKPVPSIFETLLRVMSLNDVNNARSQRELADIYIRPPVERYNILDFGSYAKIIEIGYQTARDEIRMWQLGGRVQANDDEEDTSGPSGQLRRILSDLDATLDQMLARTNSLRASHHLSQTEGEARGAEPASGAHGSPAPPEQAVKGIGSGNGAPESAEGAPPA